MSKVSERYTSEALLREEAKKKLGLLLREGSVKTKHLSDSSVTSDKLDPHLLDSIDSTHKEAQDSLNKLQKWLNEYGGGILFKGDREHFAVGESVRVTFEMEAQNGKPAHWIIKGNGQVLAEVTDTVSFTNTYTINTDILFEAICEQGEMLFTGKWSVTAEFPTWLGAASAYTYIKTDDCKVGMGDHIQGKFKVNVVQDNSTLFLLSPKSTPISKVTMGGFEVPMKDPVEVNIAFPEYPESGFSKVYYVYESLNTYNTGSFYVYINDDNDVIRGQYDSVSQEVESLKEDVEGAPIPDEEDITKVDSTATELQPTLKFADKKFDSSEYSGLGRKYLRKNLVSLAGEIKHFAGFVENATIKSTRIITRDSDLSELYWDRIGEYFVKITNPTQGFYAKCLFGDPNVPPTEYNTVVAYENVLYEAHDVYYYWNGEDMVVYDDSSAGQKINVLTQELFNDENHHPLKNTIFHVQYDYDLRNEEITVPEGSTLKFEGGSFTNGTLVLDESVQMLNPRLSGISLKGTNTALTTGEINILELYPDYFTYEDNYIYGLPKAINDFMQSINSIVQRGRKMDGAITMTNQQPTLPGITIKVPAGCYVINETINLEGSVSLKGCAGTEFWLDFGEGNEGVGICVGPNKYDTRQYHEGFCETELCNFGMYSLWTNNQYTGILDTHATHEIHHLNFGGTLKRWITGKKLFNAGYLDHYGDGRSIHDIHGNASDWEDDYKMMFGAGDGQNLSKLIGHFKVVLVTGNFNVRDTVSVEFVLIDCNNVSMTNCYSEVNGVQCYNSRLSIKNCALGTPEHGNYNILYNATVDSEYNKGKLYRNHFTNNLEVDTPRILQAALAVGIVGPNDYNRQDNISYSALRSVVSLENVVFLGQGYRNDNKDGSGVSVDRAAATDADEFNYIYRNSNSSGYIRYLGGVTCRKDYNNDSKIMYPFPQRDVTPVNLPTGSIVSNLLTAPESFLAAIDSTQYTDARAYTDLEAGTYYYRAAIAANLRSRIGNVSSEEISITYAHEDNNPSKPCLIKKALELNCIITKNQTVVLWRYQKDSNNNIINRKYCYFQIPEDGIGRVNCNVSVETPIGYSRYLIRGDSEYMINGFKWISDPNDTFKISDFKNKTIVQRVEKISENNYRYVGSEGAGFDEVKSNFGKVGDEIAIETPIILNEGTDQEQVIGIIETLWKACKLQRSALQYVQITNPENSSVSRIPLTEKFEGTGVYDSGLGKIVYVGKVNNEYVWVDGNGNAVQLLT